MARYWLAPPQWGATPAGGRAPPAPGARAESMDEEGGVAEAGSRPDVGQVGHPEAVGSVGAEDALDEVGGPPTLGGGLGGADPLRPRDTSEAELAHQAGDPVPADVDLVAAQLSPPLACAVDRDVILVAAAGAGSRFGVAAGSGRRWPGPGGVVGGRGDRQGLADRVGPASGAPGGARMSSI